MKLNNNSSFLNMVDIVLELLCIVGFFIASLKCLQTAYINYHSGQVLWCLWLVIGGFVLIGIAFGGAVDFFKKVHRKDK